MSVRLAAKCRNGARPDPVLIERSRCDTHHGFAKRMNFTPSTEERIWAAISHLSSLAFGMGILLPIISWSDQRRKSRYASFQSLQALGYQSLGYTIWILSYLVIIILAAIILLITLRPGAGGSQSPNAILNPAIVIFFIIIFGFFAIYFVLPIIAAIACALGKDFRYPFMGNRLARYLGYDPVQKSEEQVWLNEDHEFRWVAAMGHFSILILLWGMLAPLTTWILYGKRNLFLKFQSIQTLVYQAGTTILYFAGGFIYLFGFLLLIVGMGVGGRPNFNSSQGIFGILVFGLSLLISFVLLLAVPLLHILGQWAGYRVLKGDAYRYPFIGKLVERWIVNRTPLAEDGSLSLTGESL
jgi:uncharacterized Tic20 family protein